jgi:hypothetical protein
VHAGPHPQRLAKPRLDLKRAIEGAQRFRELPALHLHHSDRVEDVFID